MKNIVINSEQKSGVSHAQIKKKNKKENKNKNIKENNIKENPEIEKEFEEFWSAYKEMGSEKQKKNYIGNKQEALKEYKALRKKMPKETLIKAFNGYADFLKYQRLVEHFEPKKKYVTTFLRSDRWKEHIDYKYEPSL